MGRATASTPVTTRQGAQWLGNFMGQGYFGTMVHKSHPYSRRAHSRRVRRPTGTVEQQILRCATLSHVQGRRRLNVVRRGK